MKNREITDQSRKVWYTGLTLFICFLCYYTLTASILPTGAGPDYPVSNDISRFVYDHLSLPVLPEDEEDLMFTPGGTTRATRPPASYLISGFIAHLSPYMDSSSFHAWRHGTGLTSALTLLVVFITLYACFQSLAYALSGAVLLGLMPQFTFIASYNNDDSAGILSASLVVMSMVFILRQGVSTKTIAIMAASCGFVLVTKFTAWLILPFAFVYTLWQARDQYRIWWKYLLIALPLIVVSGGWWVLLNMIHYGWDDPLQFGIGQDLIESHRDNAQLGLGGGYITQGASYYELLIENYKSFINISLMSFIGYLDWQRLPLGVVQYVFYGSIVVIAVVYAAVILLITVGGRLAGTKIRALTQVNPGFVSFLFAIITFQIFMYVRFNIYHDIQLQGKYVLPVVLPLVILFFCAVKSIRSFAFQGSKRNVAGIFGIILVSIAVLIHIDAYRSYIIPFYNPPAYELKVGIFQQMDLDTDRYVKKIKGMGLSITADGSWLIESNSADPRMVMTPEFCDVLGDYSLIRIELASAEDGLLQIFIDTGGADGFNIKQSLYTKYSQGDNTLMIASGIKPCKRVRIDPVVGTGNLTIRSISVAPLSIRPLW